MEHFGPPLNAGVTTDVFSGTASGCDMLFEAYGRVKIDLGHTEPEACYAFFDMFVGLCGGRRPM